MKRLLLIALLLAALAWPGWAQDDATSQAIIELVAQEPDFEANLAVFDTYTTDIYRSEDGSLWEIEFYVDYDGEEVWMGWALVDLAGESVLESYAARFRSDEEIEALAPEIEALALADLEVQALLGDPNQWEIYHYYNPWEHAWFVYFIRGLDEWSVQIVEYEEGDEMVREIIGIFDETQLEEVEAEANRRDIAIMLAYEAPGADDALASADDWMTRVQPISASQYAVEFVAGETRLFCTTVDVDAEQITGIC